MKSCINFHILCNFTVFLRFLCFLIYDDRFNKKIEYKKVMNFI